MPYKVGDPGLPANVKKMPAKKQKAWVATWNNVYATCIDGGGDQKTCEKKAFQVANGNAKKQSIGENPVPQSLIRQAWNDFRRAVQEDLAETNQMVERAISFSQMREQLWYALEESPQVAQDNTAWPIDVFYDGDGIFAIVSQAGKFYQIPITISKDTLTLGTWTQVTETFTPVEQTVRVFRQKDGQYRFVGVAATSVLNRVAQIDSRDLFDSFIEDVAETDEWPTVDFYHLGRTNEDAWEFGVIDYHVREGFCYIVSGLLNPDHPLTKATVRAFEEDPKKWGFSIEFYAFGEPEVVLAEPEVRIPVYKRGRILRVSIVREADAASLFTRVGNITEEKIRMKRNTQEALAELFGADDAAQKFLKDFDIEVDDINRTVTDDKLVHRSKDSDQGKETPAEDVARQAEETEAEEEQEGGEEPVLELDEAALAELGRQVLALPEFKLIAQAVMKVNTSVEQLTKEVADMKAQSQKLGTRVATVEKTEAQKKVEYQNDMPARATRKATFRPRDQYAESEDGEDDGGDMQERAQSTLAKIKAPY